MKNNEIKLFPEHIYHIFTHANGKENIFIKDDNYSFFLRRYEYFISPIAQTYAYCLMPNHLHLMVKIKDTNELQMANKQFMTTRKVPVVEIAANGFSAFISKVFGNLFSSYTQALNKEQDRKGSLFIPNFKRKLVDDQKYYTNLVHYIHNNPVHHGFARNMEAWKFSSYNSYFSDLTTKIAKAEVLNWFGDKQSFRDFHQSQKIDLSLDI